MAKVLKGDVERILHDLGLHCWDQGDDGFGGEWVLYEGVYEKIAKWLVQSGVEIK